MRRQQSAEGVNFKMVWAEYSHLGELRPHPDNHTKAGALRAWEQLLACALLAHVDARCAEPPALALRERCYIIWHVPV